ncbi:MAG: hypothetical protein JW891_01125 [Candidatus Lokiarchaeota archaeon]|nr:hypothetical protein [Candidatus Lokiarchaeota archaeon]
MPINILSKVFQVVIEKGVIDDEFIMYLDKLILDKSKNIFDVIQRGFIKYIYKPSNMVIWTVKAKKKQKMYLIYPRLYCSCQDFYKSVVILRKRLFCKHLLAQTICEALNNFTEEHLKDSEYRLIIKEATLDV